MNTTDIETVVEPRPPEADMTDEEILAALTAPAAVPPLPEGVRKPSWNKLTEGQKAVVVADQNGMQMTDAERAELEKLDKAELVSAFMKCNLGKGVALDETLARSLFASMLTKHIEIPQLLFVAQYFHLTGTEKAIEYAMSLRESALTITDPERRENAKHQAVKIELFARKLASDMLKRAQGLAQDVAPPEAPKKPKNKAPDVMNVQNNYYVTPPTSVTPP